MVNKAEGKEFQMPFDTLQGPSSEAISREPQLSQSQRRAIIVKALKSGLNSPLTSIINIIEDNHDVAGADTAILWYPRADGTKGMFEAHLNELYRIKEKMSSAKKGHAGRRRFRGF